MKKLMKLTLASCLLLGLSAGVALAEDLSARNARILEKAGIPFYQDMKFLNGALGDAVMGARFGSSAAVEDVQAFYRSKFKSWSLYDKYGAWILYNGKPGNGPAAYMGKQQISVVENKNLPTWFGLPQNMTTEIIIVVPPRQ